MKGFKEEILDLMKRIKGKRLKGTGKGGPVITKFDREIKKLEWNVMDKGRKKSGVVGKGMRVYKTGCG